MKNNSRKKTISLEEFIFYTVQDIPGQSEPTNGEWDLRKNVDKYLGNVDFKDRSVLELGPASGFLSFEIEKRGGNVKSIELSLEDDIWDVVPNCKIDWKKEEKEHRENDLRRVQNAYWFAHKAFNSKAKVIYSNAKNITSDIGLYDISLMGCVLLHLQDPFIAIQNMLSVTKEKAIITDLMPTGNRKFLRFFPRVIQRMIKKVRVNMSGPIVEFLPGSDDSHMFAWWLISPQTIVNMAKLFGFEKTKISYHVQYQNGKPVDLYTVVCERTIQIEDCNYK